MSDVERSEGVGENYYQDDGIPENFMTEEQLDQLFAEWKNDIAARHWQEATGIPYEPGQFKDKEDAASIGIAMDMQRLPFPSEIIANPGAYLPEQEPANNNDHDRER